MAASVAIAGSADCIGHNLAVDAAVTHCVQAALAAAALKLGDIDTVVTCGSDVLDGGMVGTRSGIAGAYGHELITVPSSGGHALAAAVSLIESGQAGNVLLAGWGEGTKFALLDGRGVQADPFYARPVGADAAAMTALQAQRLVADGALTIDALSAYGIAMRRRAGVISGSSGGMQSWLLPQWADGACAIVLRESRGGVRVTDIATWFRGYTPEPADLDPGRWVSATMANMAALAEGRVTAIEASAPALVTELAALRPVVARVGWPAVDDRINASGGGASAFFGPATGLRHICIAARAVSDRKGVALAIDLAGPIGQAASVIAFEGTE